MDPIIAYFLLRNIEKEKEKDKNFQKKQIQLSLVSSKENRNCNKILCSFCGQNYYWCRCGEKNIKEKNIKETNDNS